MMNVNQRVQVPRFGNWEAETTVPYTVCFDKAVRGRASGELIKPSSQNPEKLGSDSSPARTGLYSGEVKSADLQPSWEVPAFGDWDGQGVDAQYTVYFEKVRKRGSLGHATNETNPHNRNTAEDALPTTRNVPFGGKSPQHQKGKNSGIIMQEEAKQGSTNRVHESSAAKFGQKKMNVRQSPNSKHVIDGSTARVPHHNGFSEGKPSSPSNFGISGESRSKAKACQNEVVVPGTVLQTSSGWDESNPPQVSSKNRNNALQSSAGSNSSYNKSTRKIKEPKVNACCFPWCRK